MDKKSYLRTIQNIKHDHEYFNKNENTSASNDCNNLISETVDMNLIDTSIANNINDNSSKSGLLDFLTVRQLVSSKFPNWTSFFDENSETLVFTDYKLIRKVAVLKEVSVLSFSNINIVLPGPLF